jgi:hypothetical protein
MWRNSAQCLQACSQPVTTTKRYNVYRPNWCGGQLFTSQIAMDYSNFNARLHQTGREIFSHCDASVFSTRATHCDGNKPLALAQIAILDQVN